LSSKTAH